MYIYTYYMHCMCVRIYVIYIYIYILYFSWHSSMFIVKIVLRRGSQDMKGKQQVLCIFFLKILLSKHSVIKLSPSVISPFAWRQGLLKLSRTTQGDPRLGLLSQLPE